MRGDASAPPLDDATATRAHRTLVQVRRLDERLTALHDDGTIGFYLASRGEEATQLGGALALRPSDWIFPGYREAGLALWRGYTVQELVNQLFGNAEDLVKGRQMPVHHAVRRINFMSISSTVGTQIPQAMGMGWGARTQHRDDVAIAYFGEGAVSSGEFHVGLNFAGVFKAQTIFLCRSYDANANHAKRGLAYGIRAVRVDGNDLLAVYTVVADAAARARAGQGATLIEAVVSADAAADPIARYARYLATRGLVPDTARLIAEIDAEINAALGHAQAVPPPPLASLFDDVFAEVPPHLVAQRELACRR